MIWKRCLHIVPILPAYGIFFLHVLIDCCHARDCCLFNQWIVHETKLNWIRYLIWDWSYQERPLDILPIQPIIFARQDVSWGLTTRICSMDASCGQCKSTSRMRRQPKVCGVGYFLHGFWDMKIQQIWYLARIKTLNATGIPKIACWLSKVEPTVMIRKTTTKRI